MKKIVSAMSMMLTLAGNAMAETHSLWSGKPTNNGSAFTEEETAFVGAVLTVFFIFLGILLFMLMWKFLKHGRI